MFERFTDQSRRVVVLAQEEARRLDHDYIGTEHLLLGLRREEQGAAARALGSADITAEAVLEQIETLVGRGQTAPPGHIPFTRRAKKCLELSLREALNRSHGYIGTGHVLLGLTSIEDCTGVRILGALGADLAQLRSQVITEIEDRPERPLGSPSPAPPQRRGQLPAAVYGLLEDIEGRLRSIERHLGITASVPDEPSRPEEQIAQAGPSPASAGSPARPDELARLQAEVTRLRALLREHEIDPGEASSAAG